MKSGETYLRENWTSKSLHLQFYLRTQLFYNIVCVGKTKNMKFNSETSFSIKDTREKKHNLYLKIVMFVQISNLLRTTRDSLEQKLMLFSKSSDVKLYESENPLNINSL